MVRLYRRWVCGHLLQMEKDDVHNNNDYRYPKMIPAALADHVEKNNLQGKLKFNLFVGASTGAETEDRWATLDMIDRRYPHQVGKNIKKGINAGRIRFADKHLSMFPQDLVYGMYAFIY